MRKGGKRGREGGGGEREKDARYLREIPPFRRFHSRVRIINNISSLGSQARSPKGRFIISRRQIQKFLSRERKRESVKSRVLALSSRPEGETLLRAYCGSSD